MSENEGEFHKKIADAESRLKSAMNKAIDSQDSSLDNALNNPEIENSSNQTDKTPNKRSTLEKLSWIVGIAAGIIAIYEFVIKRFLNS